MFLFKAYHDINTFPCDLFTFHSPRLRVCWLEHRGKISLFFLMFIISIKTLVQRVIIRGAKFENGSPSFRLFFRCCWCSSWLFERPKLKRQIKEKLHVIEKIGIQKTREKFSTGWLEKGERKKEERGDRERDKKNNDQKRWHFSKLWEGRKFIIMIKIHETMNNYSRRPNTTGLGSSFKRERGERTEQI